MYNMYLFSIGIEITLVYVTYRRMISRIIKCIRFSTLLPLKSLIRSFDKIGKMFNKSHFQYSFKTEYPVVSSLLKNHLSYHIIENFLRILK